MAKVKGLKLTENEVSQTINLKELFGVPVSEAMSHAIAQDIIDRMKARTEAGVGVNGKNLKRPYSKDYSETLEFKAFGKSKDQVNMKLTGDMLGLMDVVETNGSKIKIGWQDEVQNAKAYNHNTGDTVPKRPFFGVNSTELNEIKKDWQDVVIAEAGNITTGEKLTAAKILKTTQSGTIKLPTFNEDENG